MTQEFRDEETQKMADQNNVKGNYDPFRSKGSQTIDRIASMAAVQQNIQSEITDADKNALRAMNEQYGGLAGIYYNIAIRLGLVDPKEFIAKKTAFYERVILANIDRMSARYERRLEEYLKDFRRHSKGYEAAESDIKTYDLMLEDAKGRYITICAEEQASENELSQPNLPYERRREMLEKKLDLRTKKNNLSMDVSKIKHKVSHSLNSRKEFDGAIKYSDNKMQFDMYAIDLLAEARINLAEQVSRSRYHIASLESGLSLDKTISLVSETFKAANTAKRMNDGYTLANARNMEALEKIRKAGEDEEDVESEEAEKIKSHKEKSLDVEIDSIRRRIKSKDRK